MMRLAMVALGVALLTTGDLGAETPSARRIVSHDPPPELQMRLLGPGSVAGNEPRAIESAEVQRGTTVTVTQTLPNGNFEQGAVVWTEASLQGWNLILQVNEFPLGVDPRSGSWATWLGGDSDEIAYVRQQVQIPSGSPQLKYWHWIDSEDICGFDFGGVVLNSTQTVASYDLCITTNTGGWALRSVDLSAYENQIVTVEIRIETDFQLVSNLYVDDVLIEYQATPLFADGFETNDTSGWPHSTP